MSFYLAFIWKEKRKKKYLYLLSFIYGLAISNHNLSATIFPSLFYLVFVVDRKVFKIKTLFYLFLLFLLGFSIYLYLPLRALGRPEIDWGFPITFKAFIDYITIAMAREKMFKAGEIIYSYSYYHADLGQHYLNAQNPERAIKELEKALLFDPNNASYMGVLGATYGMGGRFKDAVSILENALKKEPGNEVFKEYLLPFS